MIGDSIYYAVTHTEMLKNRRVYYHVYYDEQKHTDDRKHLMQKVLSYENQLQEPFHSVPSLNRVKTMPSMSSPAAYMT